MNAPVHLITFKPGDIRFTYRVGGILIQHEHVLCQSAGEEGFWFLPGGRAEVGESARISLLREMQEELGVDLQIERLLYVVENFFRDASDAWPESASSRASKRGPRATLRCPQRNGAPDTGPPSPARRRADRCNSARDRRRAAASVGQMRARTD